MYSARQPLKLITDRKQYKIFGKMIDRLGGDGRRPLKLWELFYRHQSRPVLNVLGIKVGDRKKWRGPHAEIDSHLAE